MPDRRFRLPGFRLRRPAGLLAALVLVACGDEAVAPVPDEPAVYETVNFTIVDASEAPRALIDSLSEALERDWVRVGQFFTEFVPPDRITFVLRDGDGSPFVNPGENTMNQWSNSLSFDYIPHQLTHLWTRYTRRLFLEEGIAVYVTEELVPESRSVNPYRGQSPHAWVSLFDQSGATTSLFSAYRAGNFAYDFRGSPGDAEAWLVFLEAGSFTRWVIETRGRDVWFQLLVAENLGEVLVGTTVEIEQQWIRWVRDNYPDPLPCEDAIGTLGSREQFWCRRAAGE